MPIDPRVLPHASAFELLDDDELAENAAALMTCDRARRELSDKHLQLALAGTPSG